ncbi:hypothetical protein Tco_1424701 [Tanacetum coccineum]
MAGKGCALHHWVHDVVFNVSNQHCDSDSRKLCAALVIAPNEPDIPHTEDAESPPNLINSEGTNEQNVQDEQISIQYTEGPSGQNTEVLVFIIKSLVLNVHQSHISNQASTSSYHVP